MDYLVARSNVETRINADVYQLNQHRSQRRKSDNFYVPEIRLQLFKMLNEITNLKLQFF